MVKAKSGWSFLPRVPRSGGFHFHLRIGIPGIRKLVRSPRIEPPSKQVARWFFHSVLVNSEDPIQIAQRLLNTDTLCGHVDTMACCFAGGACDFFLGCENQRCGYKSSRPFGVYFCFSRCRYLCFERSKSWLGGVGQRI